MTWLRGRTDYLALAVALGMRISSDAAASASYGLLAALALTAPAAAVRALAVSWLFSVLGPAFGSPGSFASVGRYLVLFAAGGSVILHRPQEPAGRVNGLVTATLFLGLFVVLHSYVVSPVLDVSILKALAWTLGTATLIQAWSELTGWQRELLTRDLYFFLTGVLVASLPMIARPDAYLASFFQGILGHPQAFGITMSLLGVWAGARALSSQRAAWHDLLVLPSCVVLVVMSGARTAGLSLVISLLAASVICPYIGRSGWGILPGLRNPRVQILGTLLLLGAVLESPRLLQRADTFIVKGTDANGVTQAYEMSRGELIDEMWANIEASPFDGIGFGLPSSLHRLTVQRDSLMGLPTGAVIEKGVLPLAVLEELGVFGAVAVMLWLLPVAAACAKHGVAPLALLLGVLLLNMGEAFFFSTGGMGLIAMILVSWGATSPRRSLADAA